MLEHAIGIGHGSAQVLLRVGGPKLGLKLVVVNHEILLGFRFPEEIANPVDGLWANLLIDYPPAKVVRSSTVSSHVRFRVLFQGKSMGNALAGALQGRARM